MEVQLFWGDWLDSPPLCPTLPLLVIERGGNRILSKPCFCLEIELSPPSFVGGHKHRNSAIGLSHYNKKGPKTGELLWPSRYLIVELTRPRNKKYPSRIFPHDIFFEKKYTWGERRLSHLLHEGNDQEEAPTSEFIMVIRPGSAE